MGGGTGGERRECEGRGRVGDEGGERGEGMEKKKERMRRGEGKTKRVRREGRRLKWGEKGGVRR